MTGIYQIEPAQATWPQLTGNIYCIGRNYADHAKELGNEKPKEPIIFIKAPASLRGLAAGPLAFAEESFHHEVELCLLLGKQASLVSPPSSDHICALGLGLDLTRREIQNQLKAQGLPWTIAKSFAGAAVLGPFVAAGAVDLTQIDLQLEVNGQLKQAGHSRDMIFSCVEILRYLCQFADLQPGDLIFTGTPAGVGPVKRGDKLRVFSQTLGIDATGKL